MKNMQRNVMVTVVAGIALMLVSSQSNAQTGLGCSEGQGNDPSIATCSIGLDCAPVGSVDCTGGACFCPEGPLAPFCACLASGPTAGAPTLGTVGLVILVGILCAIGCIGLWRRIGGQRHPA
jgi:hypothetical protein